MRRLILSFMLVGALALVWLAGLSGQQPALLTACFCAGPFIFANVGYALGRRRLSLHIQFEDEPRVSSQSRPRAAGKPI